MVLERGKISRRGPGKGTESSKTSNEEIKLYIGTCSILEVGD
jgi:hypothetical protein